MFAEGRDAQLVERTGLELPVTEGACQLERALLVLLGDGTLGGVLDEQQVGQGAARKQCPGQQEIGHRVGPFDDGAQPVHHLDVPAGEREPL
jgi:hypothetical protein